MVWWEEKKNKKKELFFWGRAFICLASGFGSGSHGEKTAMIDVWKLWLCLFWWICQTLAGVISEIRLERGRSSSCLQTDTAEVRPPLSLALCYTLLALSGGSCWWLNKRPVWRCVVLFQHWSTVTDRESGEQNRSRRADRRLKGFSSPSDWLPIFQKKKKSLRHRGKAKRWLDKHLANKPIKSLYREGMLCFSYTFCSKSKRISETWNTKL